MQDKPTDTRTAAELEAAATARTGPFGGASTVQDVPQGTLTDADRAELEQLRRERAANTGAAVAASPTPPAAGGGAISISEDRLAAIIAQAMAQGRRDAAIAGGARPEKAEEIHETTDAAQAAVEGSCAHPLSAHEFFGADGYGKCHADGCACTGRELGSAAVRAATAKAKAKTKGDTSAYTGSAQAKADDATLSSPLSTAADRAAAQGRRDAAARETKQAVAA